MEEFWKEWERNQRLALHTEWNRNARLWCWLYFSVTWNLILGWLLFHILTGR